MDERLPWYKRPKMVHEWIVKLYGAGVNNDEMMKAKKRGLEQSLRRRMIKQSNDK